MAAKSKLIPGEKKNKIGFADGIGYMWGDIGNLFVLSFVTTFLKVFYTDVLLINPTKLVTLFLVVRLWDAVNDPLWGLLVDARKPSKNGKFRPYLKVLCIPLAAATLLCFVNLRALGVSSDALILVYAYISYTVFGMLYTAMNIPYGSLASVITDDPEGRTLLSTFRSIGGGAGGAPILLILPMIVYVSVDGKDVLSPSRLLLAGAVVCALSVLSYLACYKMSKERVKSPPVPEKTNIKATYGSLGKSLPFISITIAGLFMSGLIEYQSMYPYIYKEYFSGGTALLPIQTIAHYGPMALMILFVGLLAKKFGKKELCTFGLIFAAAGNFILYFLHPGPDQAWMFIVMSFLIGFGLSFSSILVWAMVMDVLDYQEYKTGRRDEGSIYATYTFARKVGQTLASSGGMALLAWTMYADGAAPANAADYAVFSDRIVTICTLVPAIGYTVMLLFTAVFPLSKKKLGELSEKLAVKRAEKASGIEAPGPQEA